MQERKVKCKMLSRGATKAEIRDKHKVKIEVKRILNDHNRSLMDTPYILANQSVRSEHYGETPAQQTARMLKNNS